MNMPRSATKRQSFFRVRLGKSTILLKIPKSRYTFTIFAIITAIILIFYPFLIQTGPVLVDQWGNYVVGDSEIAADFSFTKFRYAAVIMLLLAIFRRPGLTAKVFDVNFRTSGFTAVFFFIILSIAINSIIIGSTNSVFQSIILFIYAASFLVFFGATDDDRKYFYKMLGVALFIFQVIAIILYWPPQNRWMGGIHPNIYAQSLIIFSAVILFMTRKWRFIGIPLALFLVVSVSSRYGVIAIVLSLLIFISLKLVAKFNVSVYVMAAVIVLPLAVTLALEFDFVRETLKLDSVTRGLGSGVSGRATMIEGFWSQFETRPLAGFGFRQRGEYFTTHNGFLNTILENGIVVSTMLLLYILMKYIVLVHHVVMNSRKRDFHAIEQRMVFCLFSALLFSSSFQPQLINFGDLMGVMVIFCLVYPVKLTCLHNWSRYKVSLRGFVVHG